MKESFISSPISSLISAFSPSKPIHRYFFPSTHPASIARTYQNQIKDLLLLDDCSFEDYEPEKCEYDEANACNKNDTRFMSPGEDFDDEEDVGDAYNGTSDCAFYTRPRIREDLLPDDFSKWRKSSPAPASEVNSYTSGEAESFPDLLSTSTSCDGRSSFTASKPKRYQDIRTVTTEGSSPPIAKYHKHRNQLTDRSIGIMSRHSQSRGASEFGKFSPVEGSRIQNKVARSLSVAEKTLSPLHAGYYEETTDDPGRMSDGSELDSSPLSGRYDVDSSYDGTRQRRIFQHSASLVYTRAPTREELEKKAAEAKMRKASRNWKPCKKRNTGIWDDQENLPHQNVEDSESLLSTRRRSYENSLEIAKLQGQLKDLQCKMATRESQLKDFGDDKFKVFSLEKKVEELQRDLLEREYKCTSVQDKLAEKESEIQMLQKKLQNTEENSTVITMNYEKSSNVVCNILALIWQMKEEAEKNRGEFDSTKELKEASSVTMCEQNQDPDVGEMEDIRKMYMASLLVAKHVPVEECLFLAEEFRSQLQHFLRCTFHVS